MREGMIAVKQGGPLRSKCSSGRRPYRSREAAESAAQNRGHEPVRIISCRSCGQWHAIPPVKAQKRSPVKAVSDRRRKENRERTKLIKALSADGRPLCAWPGPSHWADDLHEVLTRGRGGSITDEGNVRPLCREHHDLVTAEDPRAYEYKLIVHSWEREAS
jgi:hypothetical protein